MKDRRAKGWFFSDNDCISHARGGYRKVVWRNDCLGVYIFDIVHISRKEISFFFFFFFYDLSLLPSLNQPNRLHGDM